MSQEAILESRAQEAQFSFIEMAADSFKKIYELAALSSFVLMEVSLLLKSQKSHRVGKLGWPDATWDASGFCSPESCEFSGG